MWSNLIQSPLFRGVLVAALVLLIASFFWRPGRDSQQKQLNAAAQQLAQSLEIVAAEEAAQLLGGKGKLAAIVSVYEAKDMAASADPKLAPAFENALPKEIQFLGYWKVQRHSGAAVDWLKELRGARERFSEADALVSFVGIPLLEQRPLAQWRADSPPKILAVEMRDQLLAGRGGTARALGSEEALGFFKAGCADVMLLREGDMALAKPEKTPPRKLIERWVKIYSR